MTSQVTTMASEAVCVLTKRCTAICESFSEPVKFTVEMFLAATGPAGVHTLCRWLRREVVVEEAAALMPEEMDAARRLLRDWTKETLEHLRQEL
jgi:type II secretory pathway predicted ATPase ExeA